MNDYKNNKWLKFRDEVLDLDDFTCTRCGKTKSEGAILQIHHEKYLAGFKPWESALSDCKTLCKGYHAEIHGKIKPRGGWEYIAEEDLGDLIGECNNYCGNPLRYQFTIFHDNWGCLEVGTICGKCGKKKYKNNNGSKT